MIVVLCVMMILLWTTCRMSVPGNPGQELQATTRRPNSYTYRAILQFRSWKILNYICEKRNLHYREWWWILILYKIVIYFYHQAPKAHMIKITTWLLLTFLIRIIPSTLKFLIQVSPVTAVWREDTMQVRDSDKKKNWIMLFGFFRQLRLIKLTG